MTHDQALKHVRAVTTKARQRQRNLQGSDLLEFQWPAEQREIMDNIRAVLVLGVLESGGSLHATETAVIASLWLVSAMIEHGAMPVVEVARL